LKQEDSGNTSSRTGLTGKSPINPAYISYIFYIHSMTCYFRHIGEIFTEIGIEITKENKKEIDRKIHEYLGVEYKNCSQTWKLIKEHKTADPERFIKELKTTLTA
jgi:hypothetical protein